MATMVWSIYNYWLIIALSYLESNSNLQIKRLYSILCEVFNGTFSFRLSKLQAVLQMDFEVEDVSSQSEIQVIKWELTLPDEVKMMGASEGTMRIYTTQRDFVGLAPLVMVGYGTSLKIVKKEKVKTLYLRQ